MRVLVAYSSRKGNTRLVAERIAAAVRHRAPVELINVEDAARDLPDGELVVVGGPTEAHGMTQPLVHFFAGLHAGAVAGRGFGPDRLGPAAVAVQTRGYPPRSLPKNKKL